MGYTLTPVANEMPITPQALGTSPSPLLGSEREAMRDRHHYYAKTVARGLAFPGPESISGIFLSDPAFLDLVAVYRERL